MEKLKIDKKKHNHKLTDLLKVAIFSLIMLAPMFAIVSKCLYVACNKNAYESYSGTTYIEKQPIYYETNEVETPNDINVNNIYKMNSLSTQSTLNQFQVYFNLDVDLVFEQFNISYENVKESRIYQISTNKLFVDLRDNNNNQIWTYEITSETHSFNFIPISISNANIFFINDITESNYLYVKEYIDVVQQETLDNVFYLAVNDIKNETLFNWTTDTAIYGAINGMCNGLAVQDGVLPILLTYWSLMTAIYIVFDLIIFTFTKITHFVNSD